MVYCVWGAKCQCDKGSCFGNHPWVEKGNAVVVVVVVVVVAVVVVVVVAGVVVVVVG